MSYENEQQRETFGQGFVKFLIAASVGGTIIMGSYLMFEKVNEFFGFVGMLATVLTLVYLDDRKKKD